MPDFTDDKRHDSLDGHCIDCCCDLAWKALGISKYTGKSIPEHIAALAASHENLLAALKIARANLRFLDPDDIVAQIDAALAKAEGRP